MDKLYHRLHTAQHAALHMYGGRAPSTGRRGSHQCGGYTQGQGEAHLTQVYHNFVCRYCRVCNCSAQFMRS